MRLVVAFGSLVFGYSVCTLQYHQLDLRFLLLLLLTVVISSRIGIKVPRVNTTITVADTFVFLTLLLYGIQAAVVVAAADGLSSGLRLSKKWITVLFNAAATSCSVLITGVVSRIAFGSTLSVGRESLSTTVIILSV